MSTSTIRLLGGPEDGKLVEAGWVIQDTINIPILQSPVWEPYDVSRLPDFLSRPKVAQYQEIHIDERITRQHPLPYRLFIYKGTS